MDAAESSRKRAMALLGQARYDLAEREVRQWISNDPQSAEAYSALGICLAERSKPEEARMAARHGIQLDPAEPFSHFAMAWVEEEADRTTEARAAIEEAIRLDPERAAFWALLGRLELDQKKYEAAIRHAEKGLELDPEDAGCVAVRNVALSQTGRAATSADQIRASLAKDPENAATHASLGWSLLRQGKHKESEQHLREALRLQPDMEWAREGVLQAIKARSPIYRVFLAYFLFISRLPAQAKWGVVIGGYIGFRLLRGVMRANPSIAPYLLPLMIAYLLFALGTFVAAPLANLTLMFNSFARLALRAHERVTALVFGVSLVPPAALGIAWAVTGSPVHGLAAIMAAALCVPMSLLANAEKGAPLMVMSAVAAVMTAGCGAVIWTYYSTGKADWMGPWIYFVACMLTTWIANAMAISSKD